MLGGTQLTKNEMASSNVRIRKGNGLTIAFLNIVSLTKYRNELEIVLKDNEIDIIGLCETRFRRNS